MKKTLTRVAASIALVGGLALGGAGAASALAPGGDLPGVGMVIVTSEPEGITYHLYDTDGNYMGYTR
ncbi:hypothetical protein [Phytoactinopolyspora endophytica]|uniref:hypothetical protein n=1 Tax=Phytoactinopolyspora endophytica TaxID=1642495 RepID=UPI00101C3BEF|nr:hypothetical protein [Phytoactinopolyspora endophytica]